jgi:hypothetical protein
MGERSAQSSPQSIGRVWSKLEGSKQSGWQKARIGHFTGQVETVALPPQFTGLIHDLQRIALKPPLCPSLLSQSSG